MYLKELLEAEEITQTGAPVTIAARTAVTFKAGAALKRSC